VKEAEESACAWNGLGARTWKQNALHRSLSAGLLTEAVSTEKFMAKALLMRLKWLKKWDTVVMGRCQSIGKPGRKALN
jgi:hypothetical protein